MHTLAPTLTFDQRIECALSWLEQNKSALMSAAHKQMPSAEAVQSAAIKLNGDYTESNLITLEQAISHFQDMTRFLKEVTND